MALAGLGPWNEFTPGFFTQAMERGAELGVQQSDAADRLKLAYDSLASKERSEALDRQMQQKQIDAANALKAQQAYALAEYRSQMASNQAQRIKQAADELTEKHRHNIATETPKMDEASKILMQQNARDLSSAEKQLDKLADEQDSGSGQVTIPTGQAADALRTKAIYLRSQIKGPTAAPVKEITRQTKDGKLAVFDANTKKFLRYADTNVGGNNSANQ